MTITKKQNKKKGRPSFYLSVFHMLYGRGVWGRLRLHKIEKLKHKT